MMRRSVVLASSELQPLGGIARATKDRATPLQVAMWCITSVDRDEEHARATASRQTAFYLSTPSYATVVAGSAP